MSRVPTTQTAIAGRVVQQANAKRPAFVLADVVFAVLGLHRGEHGICTHCTAEAAVPWPCDTVKVLAAGLGLKEGDWRA